jgi:hypothetical protein
MAAASWLATATARRKVVAFELIDRFFGRGDINKVTVVMRAAGVVDHGRAGSCRRLDALTMVATPIGYRSRRPVQPPVDDA